MNELEKTRFLDLLEADQSDPDVQYELGRCYLTGTGVEKNSREAEGWLRRAAEQGHEGAAALLASAEESQEKRAVLSEDTLPDWCEAAEEGDAQAQYEIAAYFLDNPDPAWESDVMRYLEMAVDQGHPKACLRLGELLLERDAGRAVVHLRNAAECGESRAMELLGECYALGRGVERDVNQAEEWFVAWAQRGSGEDMLKLACRYKEGNGVPRSLGRGLSWLKRAQLAGAADAEVRYNGRGVAAGSQPQAQNPLG